MLTDDSIVAVTRRQLVIITAITVIGTAGEGPGRNSRRSVTLASPKREFPGTNRYCHRYQFAVTMQAFDSIMPRPNHQRLLTATLRVRALPGEQ